jgi:hypothetical protein
MILRRVLFALALSAFAAPLAGYAAAPTPKPSAKASPKASPKATPKAMAKKCVPTAMHKCPKPPMKVQSGAPSHP